MPGDLLIGTKGTIGKVGMVSKHADEQLLAGQTTVVLRLGPDTPIRDPRYLLRYLELPAVREYLESSAGGATIQFIRNRDLGNLPVLLPTDNQEKRVIGVHEEISSALAEASRLQARAKAMSDNAFESLGG